MIRFLVSAILMVTALVVHAQPSRQYNRKEFTFKSTNVTYENGDISHVKVAAYVGDKLIKERTYELVPPVSESLAETIGNISEDDINFDGYPDMDVYLGYMGGFANNTNQEAWLWDQTTHTFVDAQGYSEIGDPQLDPEKKYISTVLSSGPEHRVTTYYRWDGPRLQEYLTHTWAIEGDDDFVDFTGVLNLPCHRIDARLNRRIPVIIVFQKEDHKVAGYIYYPRAKHPAPILIVGSVRPSKDKLSYQLDEYQPDGTITGIIHLETPVEVDFFSPMEGTWTNPETKKSMNMSDMKFSREMPNWFTQSPLDPRSPNYIIIK